MFSQRVRYKGRFVSHTVKLNGSIALQFSIFIQRNKENIFVVIFRGSWRPLDAEEMKHPRKRPFFSTTRKKYMLKATGKRGKKNSSKADNYIALNKQGTSDTQS